MTIIDALLKAVESLLRDPSAGFDYNKTTCKIMADGEPAANCGDVFLAVHQGPSHASGKGRLDEEYDFSCTLTMRCRNIPKDRVGDSLLARDVAKAVGFNRRCEAVYTFLHENWFVLFAANNYLVAHAGDAPTVYGFCEPPRYQGMEDPTFVVGAWFTADPEAEEVGLKAEMRFGECRRFQGIATFV